MIEKTSMQRRERGGILAWLAISFLLISACFVIAGVVIVHNIKVHEFRSGKEVHVETPFGSLHVQQDGGSAGLFVYPGAKPVRNHDTATVDLSTIFGDGGMHIVAGKWETSDPIAKVERYYENKFPDMSVIQHNGRVEMHSDGRGGKRVIMLTETAGATEISLASVGEPRAN